MTTAIDDLLGGEQHRQLIDRLLRAGMSSAASFTDLMPLMEGAGPADVIEGLRRHARFEDTALRAEALLADARRSGKAPLVESQPEALPLPHPLDSEWRFSSETVEELAGRLIGATRPGEELLLVGTPSLAVALGRSGTDRRIRFVGPDDVVSAAVRDLFAGDPRLMTGKGGDAAVAVVDPPWYADHFAEMLAICARGCRPGAPVLTVVPRTATRPGIPADLQAMLDRAAKLGLETTKSAAMEVRYRTPLFEARSLESTGIRADLGDWRRGDCLTLRRSDRAAPVRLAQTAPPGLELTLAGCRIRLLLGVAPDASGIQTVEKDEVSASVSARSSTRSKANLWTSTNRALVVDERACVDAMIAIAEQEGIVLPSRLTDSRIEVRRRNAVEARVNLIHYIRELFRRERQDAARLAGEGSWLGTARDLRCLGEWSNTSQPIPSGIVASANSSNGDLVM